MGNEDKKPDVSAFICSNIGQNDDGVRVEQLPDGTFKAWTKITHIFGSEVDAAPLEGFGGTEAGARAALEKELRDFNDSLWL